ncbi:MAG: hypothetical protein KDD51_14755 [Bdellovibrionales bacterium]|nr:hypothetical protein [Bdellovibrionales bacterium]
MRKLQLFLFLSVTLAAQGANMPLTARGTCMAHIASWAMRANRLLGLGLPDIVSPTRIEATRHRPGLLTSVTAGSSDNFSKNQLEAARFFGAWFRGFRRLTYLDMLRTQHKIACLGKDGTSPYKTTSAGATYDTRDIAPGKLRMDIASGPLTGRPTVEVNGSANSVRRLKTLLGLDPDKRENWKVEMPHLGSQHYPDVVADAHGNAMHFSPRAENMAVFFEQAGELMAALQDTRWLPLRRVPSVRSWLVDTLSDYYQLAIVGLPFVRINQSLLMGHVNYVLMLHGFEPIEHGLLYLEAAFLPPDLFRQIFRGAVYRANPWIPVAHRDPALPPVFVAR